MAYFSCLKLDVLQDHASRWANTFPKVTRISLHQYIGHHEPPATFRFAIIFELELEAEVQEKQEDGTLKVSSEAFDIFAYDYFWGDLFKKVYNYENIDPYYKNEWFFFPKYLNEKWPDFAPEEPCWQLFPIERLDDVEESDKAQSIAPQTVESQSEPAQERGTPEQREAVNFFTRENADIWHIGFEGKDARVNHLTGLQYIGYLLNPLREPGKPVKCSELYQAVSGKTPDNLMSEDSAIGEGLNIGSSKQAVSDRKTRKICLEKYQELQEKLPDVGMEEQEEIEAKMKVLMPYLTRRNIPDPNEKRAQVNIGKRLDTAYEAISKAKMEELAKHLQDHIKPDGAFGLSYSGSITWEITL